MQPNGPHTVNTSIEKAADNKKTKNRPPIRNIKKYQNRSKSAPKRPTSPKTLKTPKPHNHHPPPQNSSTCEGARKFGLSYARPDPFESGFRMPCFFFTPKTYISPETRRRHRPKTLKITRKSSNPHPQPKTPTQKGGGRGPRARGARRRGVFILPRACATRLRA
jgi:hypothetical protein